MGENKLYSISEWTERLYRKKIEMLKKLQNNIPTSLYTKKKKKKKETKLESHFSSCPVDKNGNIDTESWWLCETKKQKTDAFTG